MYGGKFSGLDRCGVGAAFATGTGLPTGTGLGSTGGGGGSIGAAERSTGAVSSAHAGAADAADPMGSSNAAQAKPAARILAPSRILIC